MGKQWDPTTGSSRDSPSQRMQHALATMQHTKLQDSVCISKSVCQAPQNPALCSSLKEHGSNCSQLTLASHQSPLQTGTCQFKGKAQLVQFPFALLLSWVMDKYNFSYCSTTFYLPQWRLEIKTILVACTGKRGKWRDNVPRS